MDMNSDGTTTLREVLTAAGMDDANKESLIT